MDLKRQPTLLKEPLDPIDEALAELRKLPERDRWEGGKDLLVKIVELVLREPGRAAVAEETARLLGKNIVEAQEFRSAVERASLEIALEKGKPKPLLPNVVRVVTDPERVMASREAGRSRVLSEYNPFSDYWMK